jgi:hypothetical protein
MRDRARICFIRTGTFGAATSRATRREIQSDALLVVDLRREHDVVLDPAEHYSVILILIFHNLPG